LDGRTPPGPNRNIINIYPNFGPTGLQVYRQGPGKKLVLAAIGDEYFAAHMGDCSMKNSPPDKLFSSA
jgi:hypothetical protein